MRRIIMMILMLPFSAITVFAQGAKVEKVQEKGVADDPEKAEIVTSDIALFWHAYDRATPENNLYVFRDEYLRKGSYGLKEFTRERIGNSCSLVEAIEKHPKYYGSIRENTLRVESMKDSIRASFRKLKQIYDKAAFPGVYFLIGRMNSGGTFTENVCLAGLRTCLPKSQRLAQAGSQVSQHMLYQLLIPCFPHDLPLIVPYFNFELNQDKSGHLPLCYCL